MGVKGSIGSKTHVNGRNKSGNLFHESTFAHHGGSNNAGVRCDIMARAGTEVGDILSKSIRKIVHATVRIDVIIRERGLPSFEFIVVFSYDNDFLIHQRFPQTSSPDQLLFSSG